MTDETTPTIPPERARIEPSPPPKRLDALPVLYLVGFVILAAPLIYLWKHPGLPRGAALEVARMDQLRAQINAIQGRVDQLEGRPAPAAPNLAPIEGRLAELERRPALAPANLAPLEAQIAALQARPAPDMRLLTERVAALDARPQVDVRPIEARIAALEAKPPVDLRPLEARIAAIDAKPPVDLGPVVARIAALEAKPPVNLTPLQQRIDANGQKESSDLDGLTKRLDGVEATAKQTESKLAAVAAKAQMAGKLQGVSAALEAGQRLGEIPGAPPALARFAHDAPPTESGLRLSFDSAAAEAHRVSQPAITDNQPLLNRMWTRAQQAVTVRQGDNVLVGDPIAGVIAHARQALDAGDLAGAVKTLDGLAGPAKAAMADWVAQAQSLLDARAAIGELAARG